jgi:hypothetical protein
MMGRLGRLAALVRGDFLERTRRYSFLITLAAALWAGYAFLPPQEAHYVTLRLGQHRGIYNSAWVGAAIAMLTSIFLGLIGFYLVSDSVGRDRRRGVGEVLAATPLSRFGYLLGKALSNWLVLAGIALAVALSGAVTQWVRGEDPRIDLPQLLAPYLLLTLPALAFIAAVAVLFECVPGLRSGAGHVVYFFVWGIGLSASAVLARGGALDYAGVGAVLPSMERACAAAFADFLPGKGDMAMGINVRESGGWSLTTFTWPGIDWTPGLIAWRLFWLAAALGVVALATLAFDRFATAPATPGGWSRRAQPRGGKADGESDALPAFGEHYLAPASIGSGAAAARLLRLLASELRLMLRGASRFWYLGALGLWIASIATPLDTARLRVLPLVWLWPVLLWSSLGVRERRFGTDQILFSAPRPLALQLPASWLAGVGLAVLTALPIGLRLLAAGEGGALLAWVAGAAFVPALALALGVWTGGSRAFEAVYTAMWYIGPLQPVPALDFMGASREAVALGMPGVYAAAAGVLLALGFLGRKLQLSR